MINKNVQGHKMLRIPLIYKPDKPDETEQIPKTTSTSAFNGECDQVALCLIFKCLFLIFTTSKKNVKKLIKNV